MLVTHVARVNMINKKVSHSWQHLLVIIHFGKLLKAEIALGPYHIVCLVNTVHN